MAVTCHPAPGGKGDGVPTRDDVVLGSSLLRVSERVPALHGMESGVWDESLALRRAVRPG
jgi:hypothetical protein